MMSVGDYEIKSSKDKNIMEKNKYIHTNGILENGFQFDVINASTTYIKHIL